MAASPKDRVRALLRGRKIIVVGGQPRPENIQNLRAALALLHVQHCTSSRHDASPRSYAKHIEHDDAVLVVVLCGASRTHQVHDTHQRCRRLCVPFIDCDKIPNANLLLHMIVELELLAALEQRVADINRRQGGAA